MNSVLGIVLALAVCVGAGLLCSHANRIMFLVKEKNERHFPWLGVLTLFIAFFVGIFFMVLADFQYSKFMSWVLQIIGIPAIYLVLFKTFFFTTIAFACIMLLNICLYKQVKWFNSERMMKYEMILTVIVYTVSYFFLGDYLFKELIRFFIRTYIKY